MKRVNALELRQSLGKILAALQKTGQPIVVEKARRPVAVLITLKDFNERFAEKAAAEERDRIIAEIEQLAASVPVADPRSGLEILRELRGYED